MGYRIEAYEGEYLIINGDDEVESVWDSEEEALEELRSLRTYNEDLVDFFARATPGTGCEEEDAET